MSVLVRKTPLLLLLAALCGQSLCGRTASAALFLTLADADQTLEESCCGSGGMGESTSPVVPSDGRDRVPDSDERVFEHFAQSSSLSGLSTGSLLHCGVDSPPAIATTCQAVDLSLVASLPGELETFWKPPTLPGLLRPPQVVRSDGSSFGYSDTFNFEGSGLCVIQGAWAPWQLCRSS